MTFQAVFVHIFFLSLFPLIAFGKKLVEVDHLGAASITDSASDNASLKIKAATGVTANRRGQTGLLAPEKGWKYQAPYIIDPAGNRVFQALLEKLGEGGFGAVVKVKNLLFGTPTNMKVNGIDAPEIMAMKVIKANEVASAVEEVPNLKKVQPNRWVPFILKELLINRDLYLIMELALGKSMFDYLAANRFRLPLDEVKSAFKQLVKAIEICHARDVAHRDLKPENFNWDGSELKLLDFGLAANLTNGAEARKNGYNKLSNKAGTAFYVAPEVVSRSYYEGPPADCWGLGVVLYVMLTGKPPFDGDNDDRVVAAIKRGNYDGSPLAKFDGARDLVSKLLVLDPKKRLTATEILSDAFIVDTPCPEQEAPTMSQSLSEEDLGHVVLPTPAEVEASQLRALAAPDDFCVGKNEYTNRLMFNKLKQFCCCSDANLSGAACICRAGKSGFMSQMKAEVCSATAGKEAARAYVHPGRGHCRS